MCGCIPLPSWAGGNARDDAPPTRRQERERYAEELRRERGLSTDEEERRLEERLAELEAKHAEALRAGDAGRLADLEGAIADLERKLEVDAAAYTPEPRKSFIPSLGSIAVRNRHRHAIEQASRRWRGGRRGDSGRTRRKFDFHTARHAVRLRREQARAHPRESPRHEGRRAAQHEHGRERSHCSSPRLSVLTALLHCAPALPARSWTS